MAAKPTKLPEWASDASADIVEPNAGKKFVGWVPSERPPSQYFNWLLNTIYLWLLYLKEGVLSGVHSFDNDVSVAGDLSVTGDVKHGTRQLIIDGGLAVANNTTSVARYGIGLGWQTDDSADYIVYLPITFRAGDRISTIEVFGSDDGNGSNVQASLWKFSGFGTNRVTTNIGLEKSSPAIADEFTLTFTGAGDGLPLTLTTTDNLLLAIKVNNTLAVGDGAFYSARVTYDHP